MKFNLYIKGVLCDVSVVSSVNISFEMKVQQKQCGLKDNNSVALQLIHTHAKSLMNIALWSESPRFMEALRFTNTGADFG